MGKCSGVNSCPHYLVLIMISVSGFAAEAGVVVIGSKEQENIEAASLDNMQVNVKADVPGYASFLPLSVKYQDNLWHYIEGNSELRIDWFHFDDLNSPAVMPSKEWDRKSQYYASGEDAEYLIIKIDITNLSKTEQKYSDDKLYKVKAFFDDNYEFKGWISQFNYDNTTGGCNLTKNTVYRKGFEWLVEASKHAVIVPNDMFAIKPMYTGHYVIGCTLPNAVVESKAPLRVEVQFGEHTLTFHIRK